MKDNLNIGIAGLGTVGCGVVEILNKNKSQISKKTDKNINIYALNSRTKRKLDIDGYIKDVKWHENAIDLANDNNIDLIVEAIGGEDGIAFELCETALKNKKHVVTANKALIAVHGDYLAKLAEKNNVSLCFEAAVAGGIPAVKTLKEALISNNVKLIMGIMNGTCNYILTKMEETGKSFTEILKEAQDLGYAEADPKFDVEGFDTAHKLAILSSIAFGNKIYFDYEKLHIEGISKITFTDITYAKKFGYKIKLIAIAKQNDKNEISQYVFPALLDINHPLSQINDVKNAVFYDCDYDGEIMLTGAGAGAGPTATAVIADIADIACNRLSKPFAIAPKNQTDANFSTIEEYSGSYYIRINVQDQSGVLAQITNTFKTHDISMKEIIQNSSQDDVKNVDITAITHQTYQGNINKVIKEIGSLKNVTCLPQFIRIHQ